MSDTQKLESQHKSEKKPKRLPLAIGSISAMEEKFGLANGFDNLASLSATHQCFLAWHGRLEDGADVGDFEDWRGGLLYVRAVEDPKDEGPTGADS